MSVPILGQGQANAQAQLQAAVGQLTISLYSQAAAHHLASLEPHQAADAERLRRLARDAAMAAKCYFEGLGLAEFHATSEPQAQS